MNHMQRVAALTPLYRQYLDYYVAARADGERATRKLNLTRAEPLSKGSLATVLNRLGQKLGFTCLADLAVWYELTCKGPENIQVWQEKLGSVFAERHTCLDYVSELLEMSRAGEQARMDTLAAKHGISSRTLTRRLDEFAGAAGIVYSLNWMVFLYAMHQALEKVAADRSRVAAAAAVS